MSGTGGGRASAPAWIAGSLWVLVLGGFLIHLVPGVGFGSGAHGGPSQYFVLIVFVLFLLSFASVGALVASRLPRNPIGWLLLGAALGATPLPSAWRRSRCTTRGWRSGS